MTNTLSEEQKQIINNLFNNDENIVISTLNKIRDKGGIYTIQTILNLFFNTKSESVKNNIYELFCDLKDEKIAKIITENIENYQDKPEFSKIISALWQSSLHFENLLVFLSIFDKAKDDTILIELFTLIEENFHNLNQEEIKNCKDFFKPKYQNYSSLKRQLAEDILSL